MFRFFTRSLSSSCWRQSFVVDESRRCRRYSSVVSSLNRRSFHATQITNNFWEADKKGGYKTKIVRKPVVVAVKEGMKELEKEAKKLKTEVACTLRCDSSFAVFHGDYEIIWKFDSYDMIGSWVTTSDSDHNEGKSVSSFVLGPNKSALFRGTLNTDVPKDGIIKNAGYCNIRSPKNYLSFKRPRPYEWGDYTHLLLRVRGDGRTYQMVLNMDREYDLQWNDQYNYPLYTRGGPYWQIAKIPFSKFFLSAKGRVQDKQEAVQLNRISTLGITIADSIAGSFQLEIDYIALIFDENHLETFEYEMYPVSISVFS